MKRILALLISLMMVFALVACNNTEDPDNSGGGGGGGSGGGGGNPTVTPGDDYDPDDPEQYIYRSVFANSPYKDQWDTGRYGADVSGVWDSSVLPSVFPAKPDSVTAIDRTEFVGLLDEKIANSPPGELYVEVDYDTDERPWTYFFVMFDGTEATLNTLIADLAENFECVDDREDSWGDDRISGELHAYSTEWYLFLKYSQDLDWSSEERVVTENFSFTLYAMPVHHQLPKVVEGVPLLQVGYLTDAVSHVTGYSAGDDDYTYLDYDYQTGTPSGSLKENWTTDEIVYYGVKMADVESYATQLVNAGLTLQSSSNGYWYFKKGEINVTVRYDEAYKSATIYVQLGNWG